MALEISLPTSYGVNALYWRIVGANIDYAPQEMLVVRLGGYASAQARAEGKAPLETRQMIFADYPNATEENPSPYAGPFVAEPSRAAAYAAIKSIPGWEGAQDV